MFPLMFVKTLSRQKLRTALSESSFQSLEFQEQASRLMSTIPNESYNCCQKNFHELFPQFCLLGNDQPVAILILYRRLGYFIHSGLLWPL